MASQEVACIAIVGPDNNPILIRKYKEAQDMELDSLLFCSLDYFDTQNNQKKSGSKERFLGSINTSDKFQIWGYRAALQYKIIVLTGHLASTQDGQMKAICEKTRDVLFDAIMDPFYTPFAIIEASGIIPKIDQIAQTLTPAPG